VEKLFGRAMEMGDFMRHIIRFTLFLALCAALLPAVDANLLRLMPSDSRVLAGIDVQRARDSQLGRFLLSQVSERDQRHVEDLVMRTGFDPRYDVQEVLIGSQGAPGSKSGMVAVRGNFQIAKIENEAKQKGAQVTQYAGATVLSGPRQGDGLVAFLNSQLAIAGPAETVKAVLDRGGAAPAGVSTDLAGKAQNLSAQFDAWMVSTVPVQEYAAHIENPNTAGAMRGQVAGAVREMSVGLKLGTDVEVHGQAVTRSEADARALADVLRFVTSLMAAQRTQTQQQGQTGGQAQPAPIVTLLDTMKLETSGNVLNVFVTMPEAQLESIIRAQRAPRQAAPSREGRRGQRSTRPGTR
jgi:hypothetical protein